jgi:hypothetical protein
VLAPYVSTPERAAAACAALTTLAVAESLAAGDAASIRFFVDHPTALALGLSGVFLGAAWVAARRARRRDAALLFVALTTSGAILVGTLAAILYAGGTVDLAKFAAVFAITGFVVGCGLGGLCLPAVLLAAGREARADPRSTPRTLALGALWGTCVIVLAVRTSSRGDAITSAAASPKDNVAFYMLWAATLLQLALAAVGAVAWIRRPGLGAVVPGVVAGVAAEQETSRGEDDGAQGEAFHRSAKEGSLPYPALRWHTPERVAAVAVALAAFSGFSSFLVHPSQGNAPELMVGSLVLAGIIGALAFFAMKAPRRSGVVVRALGAPTLLLGAFGMGAGLLRGGSWVVLAVVFGAGFGLLAGTVAGVGMLVPLLAALPLRGPASHDAADRALARAAGWGTVVTSIAVIANPFWLGGFVPYLPHHAFLEIVVAIFWLVALAQPTLLVLSIRRIAARNAWLEGVRRGERAGYAIEPVADEDDHLLPYVFSSASEPARGAIVQRVGPGGGYRGVGRRTALARVAL